MGDENTAGSNRVEEASKNRSNRKRGSTKLPKLFGSNEIRSLEFNDKNQPIGDYASIFGDGIGVILKSCRQIQWAVEWPNVDPLAKDWIGEQLKNHFTVDDSQREDLMKYYVGQSFRQKKKKWKANHYTKYGTDEERLLMKPEELSKSQWMDLVRFWGTPEHKKIAARNKVNRSKQEVKHTMGQKSCARVIHELEVAEGTRPSRGHLFAVNHINKETHDALDGKSRAYIADMRALAGVDEQGAPRPLTDEHYYQVMPADGHGCVRGMGPGVTPTRYFGSSSRCTSFGGMEKRMQEEIDKKVQERAIEMENRLREKMMEEMHTLIGQFHSNVKSGGSSASDNENRFSPQHATRSGHPSASDNENRFSPQYATWSHCARSASKKCKLMNWQNVVVAEGRLESTDPNALVHHIPLGLDNWKIWVDVALDPNASLWRPTSEMSTIKDAVGSTVAWKKDYVSCD